MPRIDDAAPPAAPPPRRARPPAPPPKRAEPADQVTLSKEAQAIVSDKSRRS